MFVRLVIFVKTNLRFFIPSRNTGEKYMGYDNLDGRHDPMFEEPHRLKETENGRKYGRKRMKKLDF